MLSTALLTKPVARPLTRTSAPRRRTLRVSAHEEELLPLVRLPKTEFSKEDYEKLAHPHLLGGKTIGEELALIRLRYLDAERKAVEGEAHLHSENWQGDVYVGSNINTLSVLYGIFFFTPLIGLAFAALSYGKLWGVSDLYGAPF